MPKQHAAGLSHEITDLERQTMARVARRLLPLLIACYFVAYLDRVNVGFASLTMNKALGFSSAVYGFGGGIFFLGYFIFEVPSNILLAKVGARVWIARILITWGIISGCTALVVRPALLLFRPLPARPRRGRLLPRHHPLSDLVVPVLLPLPHRRHLHGGDPAIQHPRLHRFRLPARSRRRLGIAGWQWLFILEAVPAVILGVVVLALHDRLAVGRALADAGATRLADGSAGFREGPARSDPPLQPEAGPDATSAC